MRRVAIVALVSLVLLAGCSGASDQRTSRTTTPASPSVTAGSPTLTDTDSLRDISYPPGVSRAGIEDVDSLLRAHRDAISRTDFRVSAYHSFRVTYPDGEEERFQTWMRAKSDRREKRAKSVLKRRGGIGNGRNATFTVYSANGTHYQRANVYYARHFETKTYRAGFGQLHNSTTYLNASLNRTLTNGTLTPIEVFSDDDENFIRFRISFPGRDGGSGSVTIRQDGLITRVRAPDDRISGGIDDGVDRYRLVARDDIDIAPVSWKEKARRGVREQLREVPDVGGGYAGSGSACNNDGDQSYDEDNDRDNDGICDEG